MSTGSRSPGAAGLGALWLGLILTPWVYVLFGAVSAFSPYFALVVLPVLAIVTLDLGLEAFSVLKGFRVLRMLSGILSTLLLLAILAVLTNFKLFTRAEQLGLFATIWLGASVSWLFCTLFLGEIGPEAILRNRRAAQGRIAMMMTITFVILSICAVRYWVTSPEFIG